MRVVDEQARAVAPRQLDDPRQVGEVAGHAEDAFGHDEHAALAIAGRALQRLVEAVEVVVAERYPLVRGERGVHHRRVRERIDDDDVGLVDERLCDAEHAEVAVVEEHGRLGADECRQPAFKLLVPIGVAGQEA